MTRLDSWLAISAQALTINHALKFLEHERQPEENLRRANNISYANFKHHTPDLLSKKHVNFDQGLDVLVFPKKMSEQPPKDKTNKRFYAKNMPKRIYKKDLISCSICF